MVLYAYRCESGCGITQQMHPMHNRPDIVDCPECSGRARKMMSVPHVGRTGIAMALEEATRATADRPGVVTAPPPTMRRQRTSANPLHRTLPRP
ncbi:zinc ribbon domain-containing protein [Mycolicibacterium sp. ND9-15]|uniref:FmdB family zinc ribbon protein n=1 Tax=Mycolicibacterium sp. ND9-15 TaxID=3042320 RepID=UPI002DDA4045|nr:zinc ribbon domain-containing protein [Mycolicibacterium sp. ND9-15]WSE54665.1 zinc ribbon domain-containing protein [Mycolicibacterium sp. ND9-15]